MNMTRQNRLNITDTFVTRQKLLIKKITLAITQFAHVNCYDTVRVTSQGP